MNFDFVIIILREKIGTLEKLYKVSDWMGKGRIYGEIAELKQAISMLEEKGVVNPRTLSDCLEFLRERGFYLEGLCQTDECEYECCISEMDDMGMVRHSKRRFEGETPLEVCTKAVLAVSKDK